MKKLIQADLLSILFIFDIVVLGSAVALLALDLSSAPGEYTTSRPGLILLCVSMSLATFAMGAELLRRRRVEA